eukprot:1869563-Amphidinium_carterae.1
MKAKLVYQPLFTEQARQYAQELPPQSMNCYTLVHCTGPTLARAPKHSQQHPQIYVNCGRLPSKPCKIDPLFKNPSRA